MATPRNPIPIEALRAGLRYDCETGIITSASQRGSIKVGDPVGYVSSTGYLKVTFRGKAYFAHRVAWAMHYGTQPPEYIDHSDGDKQNNKILNLREATQSQNLGNQSLRVTNSSGYKGVWWHKKTGRYTAVLAKKYLGIFDTPEEAFSAYREAAVSLYGEFARVA